MDYKLKIVVKEEMVRKSLGMNEDRVRELNKKMAHAHIEASTITEMFQAIVDMVDSIEELVVCVFFYGLKER